MSAADPSRADPSGADVFGTAALRSSTLQTWRSSPTRLREDTAAEADLVRGGYRDRVLTELAQNAADAATRAGIVGELTVRLVDGALRVTNTGAPLDTPGVQALAALRASAKTDGVGRFGVGFTAVLAVSDAPRVLSRTGSVAFSTDRTRAELGVDGPVPALRLVWPEDEAPPAGADTEVVLPLRPGVDGPGLLDALAARAPELLLELPGLGSVTVGGRRFERTGRALVPGLAELGVAELGAAGRTFWQRTDGRVRWLVELVHGVVVPLGPDVLRAPTRTDEELSLPALLVADLDLAPDRRRLQPGASLEGLADGYPLLVAALAPEQRTRLVPRPGFPRGEVDAALRTQVLAALVEHPWLPGVAGPDVRPRDALVLDPGGPDLAWLLADVLPGLLVPSLSGPEHAPALAAVGVTRVGLAAVADAVAGLARDPGWWRELYAALDPLVHDRSALAELAGLPVPLVDGRTVLGPRTAVLLDGVDVAVPVPGLRVVHPGAAHPLLVRLGARESGAAQLLADPVLAAAVAELDGADVLAAGELADAVLALVAAAGVRPGEHPWLGALLLPDDGVDPELRAADELLLPGAPLAGLLVADAPFATVAAEVVARHGADVLRAAGVGWGFTVVLDPDATGPDHDLDDEQAWWRSAEPHGVHAVRDLELVDPAAWPAALALLHAEPETLAAVREPRGHTAWWLRRNAEVGGAPLGHWRGPGSTAFEGLLDPLPGAAVDPGLLAAEDVADPELAALLLERLADPARRPLPAVVARTHAALAQALDGGVLDVDDLDVPDRVRTLDGSVVDAATALVLDEPWRAQVLPAARLVLGPLGEGAGALAELLDVGLTSDEPSATVTSAGVPAAWAALPAVVLACAQLGVGVPPGGPVRHDELRVEVDGVAHAVDWWVDGRVHAGPAGLLAALLHEVGGRS